MDYTLPAGTVLYHGTTEEFSDLRGPAWFALDSDTAARWAGWRSEDWEKFRRVLTFVTTLPITLRDTQNYEDWTALGEELCEDTDPVIYDLAEAVKRAGLRGWYGGCEVMLCDPSYLTPVDVSDVAADYPCYGR